MLRGLVLRCLASSPVEQGPGLTLLRQAGHFTEARDRKDSGFSVWSRPGTHLPDALESDLLGRREAGLTATLDIANAENVTSAFTLSGLYNQWGL